MAIKRNASNERLNQLVKHLSENNGNNDENKLSIFQDVQFAPPDAIFALLYSYNNDSTADKINVSVGAYRDENGKPWVLPVVKKAIGIITSDPNDNHEYLPMDGLRVFTDAATKLILGSNSPAIAEKRVCGVQTISGTGAVRVGSEFLKRYKPNTIYVSNPTWANHKNIIKESGLNFDLYPYWNEKTKSLNIEEMILKMNEAPNESIFLLHACAHNPTGVDPTPEQWMTIARTMKEKNHIPFFDCAYQGFASGDLNRDAYAIRLFVDMGFEIIIAQSFSKNLGLYGERCGNLTMVCNSGDVAERCRSQLASITRTMISNPPSFGAKIASIIMNTPELYNEWEENLVLMSGRIISMRKALYNTLLELKTPGTWNHIIDQIGMFCYTGLNANQSRTLKEKFHIYLTENGRISIAGLNPSNIKRFAESLDWVVRNVS